MLIVFEHIQELLARTSDAFAKSEIKKYATHNNLQWNYSISSTRLNKGGTVIAGFNWGAEKNILYDAQIQIPDCNFIQLHEQKMLGSLARIYKPLKQYFPSTEIENCIQTNFCFFRSNSIAPAMALAVQEPIWP